MVSEYQARDADYWTKLEKKDFDQQERLFSQLERKQDMELLDETTFEEKHKRLSKSRCNTAIKINNDMKSFAVALLKADNNENSFNTNNWTVVLENFVQFAEYLGDSEDEANWEDEYESIYKCNDNDNYENDITLISNVSTTNDSENVEHQYHNATVTSNLNQGQSEIISIYHNYLKEETVQHETRVKVQNIVLLTGKGGTGKSYVIHRLLQIGNQNKTQNGIDTEVNSVWTIANNNLNAADIDGSTIASLLHLRIQKKTNESDDSIVLLSKISQQAIKDLKDKEIDKYLRLIIIDEISNVTVQKLGQLSRLFGIGMNNNLNFGGIPVLLVGDFNQKKPIGQLATTSLLELIKNKYEMKLQQEMNNILSDESNDDGFMNVTQYQKKRNRKKLKSDAIFFNNKENSLSDFSIGCEILSEARWFELTESERSNDEIHNELIDNLYKGYSIDIASLRIYEVFSKEVMDRDNYAEKMLWLKAPIIVKYNRIRITLNYI